MFSTFINISLVVPTLILVYFLAAHRVCANTCHKTASVQRWVSQNGFHRILHTHIKIPWNLTGCQLLLEEKFPAGVFVDPDELARGETNNEVHCVRHRVDIEAFEQSSQPFREFSYTKPFQKSHSEVHMSLPFHLRYHKATPGAHGSEVVLMQPSLLVSCPQQPGEAARSCAGWSEGPAPCTHCSEDLCDWTHLPYSSAQLELRIPVPNGNSDHGAVVTMTTALTMVLATAFLLWTIQSSAKKNR